MIKDTKKNSRIRSQGNIGKIFEATKITETNAKADASNIGLMEELYKVMLFGHYTSISEEIHPTHLGYRNPVARWVVYCKENFRGFLYSKREGK